MNFKPLALAALLFAMGLAGCRGGNGSALAFPENSGFQPGKTEPVIQEPSVTPTTEKAGETATTAPEAPQDPNQNPNSDPNEASEAGTDEVAIADPATPPAPPTVAPHPANPAEADDRGPWTISGTATEISVAYQPPAPQYTMEPVGMIAMPYQPPAPTPPSFTPVTTLRADLPD